jgi:hypothetical protein
VQQVEALELVAAPDQVAGVGVVEEVEVVEQLAETREWSWRKAGSCLAAAGRLVRRGS